MNQNKSEFIYQNGSVRKTKFKENIHIFRCPICTAGMGIYDFKDILCEKGHSFNIAKKGYVNFLLKPVKTEYDKEMFYSRNKIITKGFFDPILEYISDWIAGKSDRAHPKTMNIFDAGCGEGSHLGQIIHRLRSKGVSDLQGVGIDISKEGIWIASKDYFDIIWCVADLANIPFRSKQFDIILNILSPANYREFARTLKDDGFLVKVIPGSNYLKELREVFYDGMDKQTYSNDKVIELYRKNFKILDLQEIQYRRMIDKENIMHLIKMTPLSWAATADRMKQVFDMGIDQITVDLSVIVGQKNK